MDSAKFYQEQKGFYPYYYDERDISPRFTSILRSYRSGTQSGSKSPRVNGKLQLRQNPYECTTRKMYSNVVVPRYYLTSPTKISGYYQCPDPAVSMTVDTYLRDFVKNKVADKVADLVREFGINVSVHIAEFFENISWFEKRFNDCVSIVTALLTRRGRYELMKKSLTKAHKEYNFLSSTLAKHGTLPKAYHTHPDYYPKRNRYKIVKQLRSHISEREKSVAKEAAELTLEWSYAVSPIVQDLQKLASRIDNYNMVGMELKVTKGGNSTDTRRVGSGPTGYTVTSNTKVISRLVGTMRLRDLMKNTLQQFGLLDWELVLWELTPFSFVLDWCYPISNWLNQSKAFEGWDCSNISTTTTTETFCSIVMNCGARSTGSFKHVSRVLGQPAYKLMLVNPFTSIRRGVNQAALGLSLGLKK